MARRFKLLSLLLTVGILLSMFPLTVTATAENKPNTKAVDVSSISVPSYSGGTSSGWMVYDGGLGTAIGNTSGQSKMRIVTGTTTAQYSTYLTTLKDAGYVKLFGRTAPAQSGTNRHDKHLSPDGTYALYTYWTPATKQVRIIVDTHADTLRTFSYTSPEGLTGNGRTEVYMYNMPLATDGHRDTSTAATEHRNNSGSLFFIKMPDNSLFVIDGGSHQQMGDRDCEQLYAFLREITGTAEGEKMILNTWFISHTHFDHVAGFPRFLHKYNTQLELLNIMYNFDIEGSSQKYIRRAAQLFPNAKYYKPHTGESFTIDGVKFDVLYTVEDRYTPNSNNKLILNDASCLGNYTEENNISAVMRMTFDGKTMLLTGDLEKADAQLMKMYPAADLKCDLLQIPHHGFDEHTTLVKTVAPSISFVNQAESAIMNRQDTYEHTVAWKPYAGDIYYCGERTVGYAAEEGIFYDEAFVSIDYLDWKAQAYPMEEANYYDGSSHPLADPESYYRYTRVTELSKTDSAYIIVDDKVGRVLSYNAVTGEAGNATTVFKSGDEYYFAASQRRAVNWLMSYSNTGVKSGQAVTGATTYYGTVPVYKGTGDYWGTATKGRYLAIANGDTFESKGMYSSWTKLPNMLESASKELWMDLLEGGYFLIYRYTGGSYYPLYRDGNGNVTTVNNGWGSAKLTQSKISAQTDYLRHRLYAYNETPDTMLLYWTGHKDYYTATGTPLNDAISAISADLRILYRFENFPGSGEIFYNGWQDQREGSYWLEFTKTYSPNIPGDYPLVIKYKNASGTILELGTVTLHVKNSAAEPEAKQLFFSFNDDTEAREKYKYRAQYAEVNFDAASRWEFIEYHTDKKVNSTAPGTVNRETGTLQISTAINDAGCRNLSFRTFALDTTPLNFDPQHAEVIQIRLKMDNLKTMPEKNSYFRLWYYKNDGSEDIYTYERDYYFGKDFVTDGNYMTLTVDLYTAAEIAALASGSNVPTQTFNSCKSISGLRPAFHNLTLIDPEQAGTVTVDYLYIGPRSEAPSEKEKEPRLDESLTLYHSLNLASDISVNFVLPATALEGYDMDSVQLEVSYTDYTAEGDKALTVQLCPELRGAYYYFSMEGLTAVHMTNELQAVLRGNKGNQAYYSPTDQYSICTYAYAQLAKDQVSPALKTLCADLLRYGALAQSYKGYRTDHLATENMTEAYSKYLSPLDAVIFGNTNEILGDPEAFPIRWVGKTMLLDSKVSLKFVFDPSAYMGELSALRLRVSYEDIYGTSKSLTVEGAELYSQSAGLYAFTFDGLLAAELRSVLQVQITEGDRPLSCTMKYSPDTYGQGKTGLLGELCKGLFAYSDSAKAYFLNETTAP
ncbi:MAG: hypothetical protein IKT58_04095 [Oscillospiraceae bacterium]|nr:hypothetical protein [Oscillospiraceae bacterium]